MERMTRVTCREIASINFANSKLMNVDGKTEISFRESSLFTVGSSLPRHMLHRK